MNVTGELSGAGGAPAHELMPATMYGEHGLTREEVLGKTSVELGLWEDPGLRAQYAERLARERVILDLEFPGTTRMASGRFPSFPRRSSR